MEGARRFAPVFAAALGTATAACGGGVPLLHPAHVLPERQLSLGAGASGQFAFGKAATAIDYANQPDQGTAPRPNPEQRYIEGALSHAALAPGVAPWVGARAGIGGGNEAGATFTGRGLRIDARHAFTDEDVALSIGLGATAVFTGSRRTRATTEEGRFGSDPNFEAKGGGLDLPILVGWRSSASIVELWAGVRGGVERIAGDVATAPEAIIPGAEGQPPTGTHLVALRGYGGGLVGASIGLRPFSVALELDVAYQAISATAQFHDGPNRKLDATLTGVTVAPSGAIIGKF